MTRTRRLSPQLEVKPYNAPSGGWGSVRSLAKSLTQNLVPIRGPRVLLNQNKLHGFMCVSCAWAKPAESQGVRVLRKRRQGDDLGDHP